MTHLVLLCALLAADDAAVDYAREIKPLLAQHCTRCHGVKKQASGLRLDTAALAIKGGDSGPAVVANKAGESLLLKALTGAQDVSQMPPEGEGERLNAEQVALLRRWIDQGAKAPADEVAEIAGARHWSFQKIARPPLPELQPASAKIQNAIDLFVQERLRREKLSPSPEAEKATLLRRAFLDLVGLTPSPAESEAFLTDASPDAYERVLDRLLASPHYGERWGRHWLDLARYADSQGYTRDSAREIWKYREWVIDAVNRGLPFDQFTIEQFAGDLLDKPTQEQLVATGFHRNTLINEEGGTDQEQFRVDAIADRVATTGSVWLGLTLGCARCHTHKYDPVTQVEFYQFFALLNNCDEPSIEAPSNLQLARGELERRAQIRQQIADLEKQVEAQRPELEAKQKTWEAAVTPQQRARLPGPVQVAYDMKFDERDAKNKQLIEDHYRASEEARKDFPLIAQIYSLRESEPKIPKTMILRERAQPRETFVHKRGDFLDPGVKVAGGVPVVLPALAARGKQADRLDFARWLVSAENPLTPRVVVNRDWQKFFGRGLVETEDDFGVQGTLPSHPELLDWLASEFLPPVPNPYSTKRLHRLICSSHTYRQASTVTREAELDPQNKFLARQARLRLDAEIVRDVALSASGLVSRTLGGPSVFPPQPEGVFDFTQDPKPWKTATGGERYRRGMYTHFWRSSPYPMLTAFDAPGGNVTCTRRIRSNTPLQALTLANDQAFYECATVLAERVLHESPANDTDRAQLAFRLCFTRTPSDEESQRLSRLLSVEKERFPADLPAWTALCRVLLNLDEMITRE